MDYSSLLFMSTIAQDHAQFSAFFIKLAERLYDLRHVEGYTDIKEVKYMAKETLTINIALVNLYLEPTEAGPWETAAKRALKYITERDQNSS